MSFSWSRKRGGLPRRMLFLLLVVMAVVIAGYVALDRNTAPALIAMAEARVRSLAVQAMNNAVRSVMSNPLKYTDLIKVTQDANGRVMMIQADTVELNDIATNTAITTQQNISTIGEQGVGIPLGSVLGGQLLSGRGPNIYARIVPVGAVTTDYESEFQNQGINQTRHKIYLNVHTVVRIVIPTHSTQVNVDTKVLVTESIIVGEVPKSYSHVTDPNYLGSVSDTDENID